MVYNSPCCLLFSILPEYQAKFRLRVLFFLEIKNNRFAADPVLILSQVY